MFFFETSKFIFKFKNGTLPLQTIATHFRRNSTPLEHRYFTRNRFDNTPSIPINLMSTYAQKSIQMKADRIWLDIPSDLRQAESFNIFKYYLKIHFIST